MSQQLLRDAQDDVWRFIQDQADRRDPIYMMFEDLYNDRDREAERVYGNMVRSVVEVYYYYYEEERYDSREAWEAAVELVVRGAVGGNMVQIRQVQDDMSDQELRDVDRDVDELKRVVDRVNRLKRNGSSGYSARQASVNGGRRDSRDTRDRRERATQRTSSRIFKEDDVGGVRDGKGGRGRTDARAEAAEKRLSKYERSHDDYRDRRPRHEVKQEARRQEAKRNEMKYITNVGELVLHPRKPGQWAIPHYDPFTQLLFAYLDGDGFVTFEIKEKVDVNPELHKQAIKHLLSPKRNEDYVRGTNKRAVYKAGGMELDPSQVENETIDRILDEMRQTKQIKEKDQFMDLSDEMRIKVLSQAASEISQKRDLAESAKKAELIQSGKIEEHQHSLSIYNVELSEATSSRKDRLTEIMARYGKEINHDTDRTVGYVSPYSTLSILSKCESPEQQQILSNVLAGLKLGKGTIQAIAYSLSDKKLPVHLFTRINVIATNAVNMALHHLLGVGMITLTSFIDEINDLSGWLVRQVENGALTNAQVDTINRYTCSQVATLVNPSTESIQAHYPRLNEEEAVSLKHQSLFALEKGEIVYLPLLAGELGLTMGVNEINAQENKIFEGIYPPAKINTSRGFDYLVTSDGLWFKLIGHREGTIILDYVGLDG